MGDGPWAMGHRRGAQGLERAALGKRPWEGTEGNGRGAMEAASISDEDSAGYDSADLLLVDLKGPGRQK